MRRGKKKNNKNKKKNKSAKSLLVKKRICNWTGVHRECTERDNNLVRIIVGIRLLLLLQL